MCRLNTTYPYAPARNNRKKLVKRGVGMWGVPCGRALFPFAQISVRDTAASSSAPNSDGEFWDFCRTKFSSYSYPSSD